MNIEKNRLRTFESWPANVEVEPQRIAKAGFFSTGQGLEVQCFCCGGKISEWNYGDQVMARHRALDPQCPFVRNPTQSGNVPLIPGGEASTPAPPAAPTPRTSISRDDGTRQHRESTTVRDQGTWDQSTNYRSEATRLESFRTWPIPYIVAPERLARAGFYYLQQGDNVQCAFCSGVVGHWETGDDPSVEHRRHFPSCPLHYNIPVGNIPLSPVETHPPQSHDMSELGIQTHRGPRHPKYSTVESRLRTYTDWPNDAVPTPQQLAQAGFYHVGTNDQVRCFHCDGGLRHWDPDDDPWIEHARWFSQCGYVRLVKGDEFVQQAIAQRPPLLPTEEDTHVQENTPTTSCPPPRVRDVTDEELQGLMGTTPAVAALQIGLDASRIKMALRHKMEQTGMPFTTSDALIEAVLGLQMNEDDLDSNSTESRGNSPVVLSDTESEEENEVIPVRTTQSTPVSHPSSQPTLNPSRSMPTLSNQAEVVADRNNPPSEESARSNAKSMPHIPSLEEEVRRLKEARLCKICMDEEVGVVFLPCGHLVTCVNCAPSLHDCPVCRQLIKATVRTFLS